MMKPFKVLAGTVAFLSTIGAAHAASVYIPEGSTGEVLIVDTATDTVIGRLSYLPDIHGLGGAPGRPYLVAGSYAELATDEALDVPKPSGVSEDEHAAHHGAGAKKAASVTGTVSILTVINAADGSVMRRLEAPGAVHHVAVSYDGRFAAATHPNAEGVSIVDLERMTVRELIRTGPIPNYAAFSPDGSHLYVSNAGNGTVSEIDTGRWIVQRNLLAGDTPEHIVLAPNGAFLYVANVESGTVSELELGKGKVSRTFGIGGELHGLDVSDDGSTLFVSGKGQNKLVAIDLKSGAVRSAPLGPAPYHLAAIRGTNKLYVSSRDEPKVWVVDQTNLRSTGMIDIEGEGHQMVVLP